MNINCGSAPPDPHMYLYRQINRSLSALCASLCASIGQVDEINTPMQYTKNIFVVKRGGSNVYPQSMFWSKNKKNRYTPAHPGFFYIKVGYKGVFISRTCFPDDGKEMPVYSQINK